MLWGFPPAEVQRQPPETHLFLEMGKQVHPVEKGHVCMYVCKTLFTDASLVNKIVGFHKGRQTIKKRIKEDIYKRTEKERKKKK